MLAGLMVPERPVGNMYFAAWSHNVISNTVDLSNDLKMGEYRKYSGIAHDWSSANKLCSQDPSACHVPDTVLGHCLWRFHQLRRHGVHRHTQRRRPDRWRRQRIVERCNHAILQHQRHRLGPCCIPLQGRTDILHDPRRPCDRCGSSRCPAHLCLRTSRSSSGVEIIFTSANTALSSSRLSAASLSLP